MTDPAVVRVLLVDDDPVVFQLLKACLGSNSSYALSCASDYESGLAQLEAGAADVGIIDYRLGARTGLELLDEARVRRWPVPLILLTGQGDRALDEEALRRGAVDYFDKGQMAPAQLERAIRYARERAKLLQQLHDQATTDELTGLANRRELMRVLHQELARNARSGGSVALVLLDVDHFKEVNDAHGHQVGDRVLGALGRILRARTRAYDCPARYGGEEMALVLCGTGSDGAATAAEHVRQTVESHPFAEEGLPRITVSLGVAAVPEDAGSVEGLVAAADRALYEAKRQGRNRVERAREGLAQAKVR
jgi:diguanylate cyclase (GGDEF)-like protein